MTQTDLALPADAPTYALVVTHGERLEVIGIITDCRTVLEAARFAKSELPGSNAVPWKALSPRQRATARRRGVWPKKG